MPKDYDPLLNGNDDAEDAGIVEVDRSSRCRLFRISAVVLTVFGLLGATLLGRVHAVHERHADEYANLARAGVDKAVALYAQTGLSAGCPPGVGTCFCDRQSGLCKRWHFQVGDTLVFAYGPDSNLELQVINAVMKMLYSGAVHAAIVTEVKGPGLADVIVTECLKGNHDSMIISNMNEVLNYRQYHGVWVRRVDTARFPNFASRSATMTSWGQARNGEPFDRSLMFKKMILAPWRYLEPGWIAALPDCQQRQKALTLYHNGGPGKWFCSQYVAWTLAFPGGLNTDYGDAGGCATPPWDGKVENLQPAPGDLISQPYWDASNFYASCPEGCEIS
jgi:hypothetical protein